MGKEREEKQIEGIRPLVSVEYNEEICPTICIETVSGLGIFFLNSE